MSTQHLLEPSPICKPSNLEIDFLVQKHADSLDNDDEKESEGHHVAEGLVVPRVSDVQEAVARAAYPRHHHNDGQQHLKLNKVRHSTSRII